MFTVHVALRSTNAPTNYESSRVLRVARRLIITTSDLPRYTTLVSRLRIGPVRFTKLLTKTVTYDLLLRSPNETATYEDPTVTNVNSITTPVLNSPDDQPISPNVYDGSTINDYSNPTRLTFAPETIVPYERNPRAANDGEVTAVHGTDEIRTVLVDELETPGLLLRRTKISASALRGHDKQR